MIYFSSTWAWNRQRGYRCSGLGGGTESCTRAPAPVASAQPSGGNSPGQGSTGAEAPPHPACSRVCSRGSHCGGKNQDSPDLAQTPLPLADPLALAILEPALRLFEVDPNPVLPWLVEAAEQLRAFCAYFLCDGHCQLNAKLSRIGKILDSLLSQNGVFGDVKGREISFDRRIIH